MNLCTSARESRMTTLRKAQQNRYELIAFDPGIAGYGVSASQNLNCFFPGEHAPGPPI